MVAYVEDGNENSTFKAIIRPSEIDEGLMNSYVM